jgi:hypothetical protein
MKNPALAAHHGGEEGEAEAGRRADAKPTQLVSRHI